MARIICGAFFGSNDRAVRIAYEYGKRIRTQNVKDGTLGKLIMGYPDHGFVIDDKEALTMFGKVDTPNESLYLLSCHIQDTVENALTDSEPVSLNLTYVAEEYAKEQREETNEQNNGVGCELEENSDLTENSIDDEKPEKTVAGRSGESKETPAGGDEPDKEEPGPAD